MRVNLKKLSEKQLVELRIKISEELRNRELLELCNSLFVSDADHILAGSIEAIHER